MEARRPWYPSYLGFLAILKDFSLKNFSEAALLAKSLKSP